MAEAIEIVEARRMAKAAAAAAAAAAEPSPPQKPLAVAKAGLAYTCDIDCIVPT